MVSRFSHVQLVATLWTIARQASLSMGFSRQKYWSGLPFPSPGDLPNPGIEPTSLMSPALAGRFFTTSATWEPQSASQSVVTDSLRPHWLACQAPLSMKFPRQEYWSGCHSLLQGIFPIQGSNTGLLHCRWILYCLSHQGSQIYLSIFNSQITDWKDYLNLYITVADGPWLVGYKLLFPNPLTQFLYGNVREGVSCIPATVCEDA